MEDKKLRKALEQYVEEYGFEEDELPIILDSHAYDGSIVGITESNRLVYDYEKMIQEFARDEGCSELEAQEWVDYNTMRAIPYMGDKKPIVIVKTVEELLDIYGE